MTYPVAVRTPFGRFNGDVTIDILDDGTLTGHFEIMHLPSSFKGTGYSDGRVEFSGTIKTPVGELEYQVDGKIEDNDFLGIAKTRLGAFEFAPMVRRKKRKTLNKL